MQAMTETQAATVLWWISTETQDGTSTTGMLAVDMLQRAIDLAVDMPHARGCEARDASGVLCSPCSPEAVEFSILGLVFRAASEKGFKPDAPPAENGELYTACNIACHTLQRLSVCLHGCSVHALNDDENTDQYLIILLLKQAVRLVAYAYVR